MVSLIAGGICYAAMRKLLHIDLFCLIFHVRYIMSFLLDSTVGLLIIYIGLKISQLIIERKRWDSLTFGEYGKCLGGLPILFL